MDPFGNFGWNFGLGFGWILVGIFAALLILAIVQLVRFSFKDEQQVQEKLNSLKESICANKISLGEFENKIKNIV